jgi:hypothetical protein
MQSTFLLRAAAAATAALTLMVPATAGVTADEAARLKTTLTPMGAERAGNADGSIPPWTGGYTTVAPGYVNGQPRPDPFAAEKPLFSINARNAAQHEARLSEGTLAMMKKYPDYRIDVYKTHRTAAAPQWVYDNTFANATRARVAAGSLRLEGAFGGIPFPIPRTGVEAMWNRELAWTGSSVNITLKGWVMSGGGAPVLSSRSDININQMPYYRRDGSVDTWDGTIRQNVALNAEPPQKSGEAYLVLTLNSDAGPTTEAWQYFPGQRRTRKAPAIKYDVPSVLTNGITNYDDLYGFHAEFDRYEWKIVGKREMFVPYNTNGLFLRKASEVLGRHFVNPDHLRWELHRTWVVEGTLIPGKRNVSSKRRLYLDEDTWAPVLAEHFDGQGVLWKTAVLLPYLAPDIPAVALYGSGIYNLVTGDWAMEALPNDLPVHFKVEPYAPPTAFTPDRLNALGQR